MGAHFGENPPSGLRTNLFEQSESIPSEARPYQGARGAEPFARSESDPERSDEGARSGQGEREGAKPSRIGGFGGSSPRVQKW
ncbi:hypothetical protein Hesp01_26840 [Herbidospora sp. NBRC 101105]|nr:hypothetical protein Hesp01_26840 [Herbidospora sp. NBRC 101105]